MVRDKQRCRYYPDCEVHRPPNWKPEPEYQPRIPRQRKPPQKRQRAPEVEALVLVMRKMLEDGCSYGEVARTLGVDRRRVSKECPGMSQWTKSDGGKLGMANRWGEAKIKRMWYSKTG